ncbi:hypothetical protein [Amycolatopsis plumensis]
MSGPFSIKLARSVASPWARTIARSGTSSQAPPAKRPDRAST